ncbi:hypothetical protein ACFLSV_02515 [Bacteroidota bacterium]
MFKKLIILNLFLPFFISQAILSQTVNFNTTHNDDCHKNRDLPTIELSYGVSKMDLYSIDNNFSDVGQLELRLGYTFQNRSFYGKNTLKFVKDFAFLSYNSTDFAPKTFRDNDLSTKMWQFGVGSKEGYGIDLGTVKFVPYTSSSLVWSRLNTQDHLTSSYQNDIDKINRFNESFRFGTSFESGLDLQLTRMFSIQTQLNRTLVFERHLFGKHLVSLLVEAAGSILLETFTDNVLENDPIAGTIVTFLLKSGYSLGLYQLRTQDMYWPFASAAPLDYISLRFGTSFTF